MSPVSLADALPDAELIHDRATLDEAIQRWPTRSAAITKTACRRYSSP